MLALKKVNSDVLLLIILAVRLGLEPDVSRMRGWQPPAAMVRLGSTSGLTLAAAHTSNFLPHPKVPEDEIFFSRLHYFNSIRSRGADLIALVADSPRQGASGSGGEGTEAAVAEQLSPEDMDLIEILWKQDIDLGVGREAYDSHQSAEFEKIKEAEITSEKDHFEKPEIKTSIEPEPTPDPFAGLNYTIDSETGEYLLETLSELDEIPEEIAESTFFDNNLNLLETQLLRESETTDAVTRDSYLPFDENEEFCDLSQVFSPSELDRMLPDDLGALDSDYLSQIEDLEKELERFGSLDNSEEDTVPAGEMYPSMEDCWPDATTMLPLLSLGTAHPSTFPPLSPHQLHSYTSLDNNVPFPALPPIRQNESFLSMLQSSSLEAPSTEEEFNSMSLNVGPSSIGCAVAESIATLTNDTDPLPSNSIVNAVYSSEFPELLYSNNTATVPHNDMLISDLLLDEDLHLEPLPTEANKEHEHMDTSSDSISLTSGQLASVSDYENESQSFGDDPCEQEHCNDAQYFSLKSYYGEPSEAATSGLTNGKTNFRNYDYNPPKLTGSSPFVHHNHSYHIPFAGEDSRYKPVVRDKSRNSSDEDSANKDERKAKELNLPITIDDIINLAIDEYNEKLSKYELSESQLTLIRDIRRRGKNKVAAQNCRKRKMDQISNLQQDLNFLQREKMQLKSKQSHLLKQRNLYQDKYSQLYSLILQSTSTSPPNPPRPLQRNRMTLCTNSDILITDDDSDIGRGARTKRKLKK